MNYRVNMFYNAKPKIFERAKSLRENMTLAEQILWNRLKNKQILGFRFRSQHPIDIFIADFYCHSLKLIIEIDGKIHLKKDIKEYDENREAEFKRYEIEVIRFSNDEVLNSIDEVINKITNICLELQSKMNK